MSRHFFKTLATFGTIVLVALLGIFLVSYFDTKDVSQTSASTEVFE